MSAVVSRNGKTIERAHGRDLRALTLKRVSRKGYSVRITLQTSKQGKRITLIRRVAGC